MEESALAVGGDLPVDGDALEAFIEGFAFLAEIEIAPASAFAEGGEEIVVGFGEVEVVILVKEDGLVVIALEGAGLIDHFADAVGIADAVAVEEEEIGVLGDVVGGDLAAGEGGGDEEFPAGALLDALDQLVGVGGFQEGAGVAGMIGFVGDFDEEIGVAFGEEPVGGVVGGFLDGLIVGESILLAEVEEAEDGGHSQFISAVEDFFEALQVVCAQGAIGFEGGVVPGLFFAVALGAAALEVDGEGDQAGFAVEGEGGEEFGGVAVGVEILAVGVFPEMPGLGIAIVEGGLDKAGVEEEAFDLHSVVGAAGVGGFVVDEEGLAIDGDGGLAGRSGGSEGDREEKYRRREGEGDFVATIHRR